MASSRLAGRMASSSLTAMRMAWNVRRAGCPPRRRAGAGTASRTTSASCSVDVIGRAATIAAGIRRGVALVAVGVQQAGQLRLGGAVDQVGGAHRPRGIHAHVERAGRPVAEAPLGPVELRGADAEVEQGAAGGGVAELAEHGPQLVESAVAQGRAVAEALQAFRGGVDRVGILVEPDERQVGMGVEQCLGVAPAAHGGVDHDPGRDGGEQLDHQVHQDGTVDEPVALGCRPAHWRASGTPVSERRCAATNTVC